MPSVSESSPLLTPSIDVEKGISSTSSIPILLELIGARNLPLANVETYCVIQYGPRTIHRTKPFSPRASRASQITQALFINRLFGGSKQSLLQRSLRDPIWTIQDDSLLTFHISPSDIENNKPIKITLWARPRGGRKKRSAQHLESIGKIQIQAPAILEQCTEQRMEMQLMNELGQPIIDEQGESTWLAYRCRIASQADVAFVDHWNQVPRPKHWKETDIISEPDLPRGILITELPEKEVLAMAPAIMNPMSFPAGCVRIKPYPDPNARLDIARFIKKEVIKTQTQLPSRKWIQAGSKVSSLGRLYLEILSAHDLPNVDIGGKVGNETDAFCAVVYGDAMTQTDVIHDELNPHWPCWSQRAFCFHMQHPSHVLYLAVFGYKRSPLQHRPIGRIEINPTHFVNQMVYNLEYDLCGSSHAMQRQSQGRIRIRIQIEIDDERKTLMAALRPPPTVYINTLHAKSMIVARYTACGEYDNQTRFSLAVLQGYIDEMLEGYLRRILYSLHDGTRSLVFWRDQVHVGSVGFPLYSLLAFCMGVLAVERPSFIPALFCFTLAAILLQQMQSRLSSPSPWHRCFSFVHYVRILIWGTSRDLKATTRTISAYEGAEELEAQQHALRERIAQDKEFIQKKEAVAKQIEEIESFKVQNDSQPIPMEIMIVLGKVQGIVGDICRLCRLFDAIITWEESHVAFWLTLTLLLSGVILIFIPWGWLLKWTIRLLVVLLLGPQNKVLDLLWYQNIPTDEHRIYKIFSSRMFDARCRQEDYNKLRSFRHILYGKFATWVPPLFWSPHQDFPLARSTASRGGLEVPKNVDQMPIIPGQQLYGVMIPRPEAEWRRNLQESTERKEKAKAILDAKVAQTMDTASSTMVSYHSTQSRRDSSTIEQEGVEILDEYDEEAGFVEQVLRYGSTESSTDRDPGSEGQTDYEWQKSSLTSSSSEEDSAVIILVSKAPMRILPKDREDQQSMIELGFEFAHTEAAMAAFESLGEEERRTESEPAKSATLSSAKQTLLRDEFWVVDVEGLQEDPPSDPPEIPHVCTIVDAEREKSEGECGFEIIE